MGFRFLGGKNMGIIVILNLIQDPWVIGMDPCFRRDDRRAVLIKKAGMAIW